MFFYPSLPTGKHREKSDKFKPGLDRQLWSPARQRRPAEGNRKRAGLGDVGLSSPCRRTDSSFAGYGQTTLGLPTDLVPLQNFAGRGITANNVNETLGFSSSRCCHHVLKFSLEAARLHVSLNFGYLSLVRRFPSFPNGFGALFAAFI